MAKQTINIGSAPNDGTGDTARDAFDICNDNFTELYDGKADISGTPSDNKIAVWVDGTSIEGDANLLWDGSELSANGNISATGDLILSQRADHASTPGAGYGYVWAKTDGSLQYTDASGTDFDLTAGGSVEGTDVLSTGPVTDGYVLTADGAGGAAWEAAAGGGAFTADGDGLISATSAPVLDAATGDEAAYTFNYTTNKAAGNDTGLLINQTDTASPGTSLLADFQVGGATKFKVSNDGLTTFAADFGIGGRFNFDLITGNTGGVLRAGSPGGGTAIATFGLNITTPQFTMMSGSLFGWGGSINGVAQDVTLARDAANTLALRNNTNLQTYRVYESYTDASNNSGVEIKGDGTIEGFGNGTGTAPTLKIPETLVIACSDETTALTTGTGKVTFRMPYAMTLSEVRASVTTAPVGSTLTVDINEGGVSILSTVISIDASEKTSTTAATAPVISDSALADDAEITIDIDQVGSSTAGAGLKVYLIGTRA